MGQYSQPSFFVGCMNAANTIVHLFIGTIAFLSFALIDPPLLHLPKEIAHVYVTVTGFTLLWSHAIWSVTPYKGFEDNFMYPKKSKIYWIIQIIGSAVAFIGACLGVSAVTEVHGLPIGIVPVGHLDNTHGILGLVLMVLTVVSLVGATANLLLEEKLNSCMKILYAFVGTVTLIMAYVVMGFQFGDATSPLNYDSNVAPLCIVFAALSCVALLVMMGTRVIKTGSCSL